jgi:hypothetical protein
MDRKSFAIIFAISTFFMGTLVGVFTLWINIFWSMMDGLGAYVVDKAAPGSSMLFGAVPGAVILWPVLVAVGVFLVNFLWFEIQTDRMDSPCCTNPDDYGARVGPLSVNR